MDLGDPGGDQGGVGAGFEGGAVVAEFAIAVGQKVLEVVVGAVRFGLGVTGFLALGGWWMLLGALSSVLFVVALVAWVTAGATPLPPLVWLLSAGTAAWVADEPLPDHGIAAAFAVPLAAALLALVLLGRRARTISRRRAERTEDLPAQPAVSRRGTALR